MSDTYRVIVAGGGPAGLAAACLLAVEQIPVALVTPVARLDAQADPRTVALMDPALRLLKYIGVWNSELQAQCAPLKALHLIDDTQNLISAPDLYFAASELDLDAFGWNTPLTALIGTLTQRARSLGVGFVDGKVSGAAVDNGAITISLENGSSISAEVAIAADGAKSALRSAAGIMTSHWQHDQSALATSFSHSATHQAVSYEWHKNAGPFTTVPLPGQRSSLVWMTRPQIMAELAAMSDTQLAAEIHLQSHGQLGKISDIGQRRVFPMRGSTAKTYAATRVMLVGEAAHQMPPIGAQGLNISLRDVGHAADLIVSAKDAGTDQVLADYDQLRRADVEPRQWAVGLFNQSLLAPGFGFQFGRAAAFTALKHFVPLRKIALEQGLAPTGKLPFAMRARTH
jgi:2-octaprenyl-6-methoxyphenol hydroxylase